MALREGVHEKQEVRTTAKMGARIRPHIQQGRGQIGGPKEEPVTTTKSMLDSNAEPKRAPSCTLEALGELAPGSNPR